MTFQSLLRGLLGVIFILLFSFLLSEKRRNINWRLVVSGILLQIIFALVVLKVPVAGAAFQFIADFFVLILSFTKAGSEFLFGGLMNDKESYGYIFAFQVLPTIVFFSALSSLLYYLGILQKIVQGIAFVMNKTMQLSGSESLAAAANIFIGQTEAPLLVKPYLDKMTRSEIMSLMTGGMATIAGGVMAAFVGFLGGNDLAQQQLFARHLLAASIMSAPAAIIIAKMLIPETDKVQQEIKISRNHSGANVLDSIAIGTHDGVRLAINVAAMLLVFTALMAMLNYVLSGIGSITGTNDYILNKTGGRYAVLNLQFVLGYVFSPIAWLIGVPLNDVFIVGQLLGEKTILNEFYAYKTMSELKVSGILNNEKSIIIATYALCGFSNFASIGIQIGGIGTLIPNRRKLLSTLGLKALIGGTFACLLTAAIAGMLF
jgi:CNT family concentrative nucleoside transporter